ncbi:MAG: hypothetical protein ACR2L1_01765, partial [Pyrinomonadaceae bacterium]
GAFRAPIFLITYLLGKESVKLAIGAALVQFTFRFLFAGVGGALIQSFRRVEPAWKALLATLMIVPLISHLFEFLLQTVFAYATGTPGHTDQAIVRSICVSFFSALFTLYAMRRNVMIVGEAESKSLLSDILHLPHLVFDFIGFIPKEISVWIRRKSYVSAILGIAGFGIFSQMICWAVTSRIRWTYGGGKEIEYIKFWGIDGIILMTFAVVMSLLFYRRKEELHF